ncbi:MAG TPA: 3-deoxy-manno-octulosonate cytidylyltransferase [Acidimicrobiaceae bacterium]|nr:3-deoxy-manno-octulosonate cytidylyltransferase [Acidimicrobiaceae bacterium]HCV33192.1 3-deoxy-manno-octulosonate cytidylyltransferase [Acidimicrobiaceae bacterium]|tara:strand:- start:478 stop:1245 length:768 start_codon:yes stop_codon:yes gene_type:complete
MTHVRPHTTAIIPVRIESSRLPRKALLDICGLPMVVHVYRRCLLAERLDDVVVATDSEEIRSVVEAHGGKVAMTSPEHQNGTERIAEAAEALDSEIVVNVFGDEALVNPASIDAVVAAVQDDPKVQVAILVNPFSKLNSPSDIKVVLDENDDVLYLSRSDIPSSSRTPNAPMLKAYHIVPFRREFLLDYATWPPGRLEQIEYHEHLRILERGHSIRAVHVESSAVSVDTVDDLEHVRRLMRDDPLLPRYRGPFDD